MPVAWYMDDSLEDPRSEHHLDPPTFISMDKIYELAGVEYWHIDVDNLGNDIQYAELRKSRGYDYEDTIEISREKLPNYDTTLEKFYREHLHTDEEIRLFLAGSGYFDVRNKGDKWIRIKAEKGDLIVLPAGIYHRFSPDVNNYAKVNRLFSGEPVWIAYDRPADDNIGRVKYMEKFGMQE